MDIIKCALQHFVVDFARLLHAVHNFMRKYSMKHRCPQIRISDKPDHTVDIVPYSFRTVRGFFNVPHQYCETGPTVYRLYPRRLESLTICRCHYKGSTFLLSYLNTLSVGPAEI